MKKVCVWVVCLSVCGVCIKWCECVCGCIGWVFVWWRVFPEKNILGICKKSEG